MGFIWYIIIGILAGYLAGKIMKGGGFGLIVNLIVGRSVGRMDFRTIRTCSHRFLGKSGNFSRRRNCSIVVNIFSTT